MVCAVSYQFYSFTNIKEKCAWVMGRNLEDNWRRNEKKLHLVKCQLGGQAKVFSLYRGPSIVVVLNLPTAATLLYNSL